MNSKRIVRLCGYGTALLVLYTWVVVSTVLAQSATALNATSSFNIPPQPLPSALLRYTEQSGVHVTGAALLLEDKQSRGIVGQFNARAALQKILEGTTLWFEAIDESSVILLPERAALNPRPDEKRALRISDGGTSPSRYRSSCLLFPEILGEQRADKRGDLFY